MVEALHRHQQRIEKKCQNKFEEAFFKLINNFLFRKAMENVRNYGDIKHKKTYNRRNTLASEPNYHTTNTSPKNYSQSKWTT